MGGVRGYMGAVRVVASCISCGGTRINRTAALLFLAGVSEEYLQKII